MPAAADPEPPSRAAIVDGLLLADRCISGDFIAHSSYRVTGNAVPLGEATGLAADKSDLVTGLRDRSTAWATESNSLPLFADRKKPKK